MPRPSLLSKADLEDLLVRRARGEAPAALAERFGLEPDQVYWMLYRYKARLVAVCRGLGVTPPGHGGWNPRPKGHLSRPPAAESPVAKDRRCLTCEKFFPSEWKGDRVCPGCEKTEEWRAGANDVSNAGVMVRMGGAE